MHISSIEPGSEQLTPRSADEIRSINDLPPEILKIRELFPFRRLFETEFVTIARQVRVEYRDVGMAMFQLGLDDDWTFYLLHGEVEITGDSGASFRIEGESLEAGLPLSTHDTARVLATVVRDACYVCLRTDLMRTVESAWHERTLTVGKTDDDEEAFDKSVMFTVYRELNEDSLTLPLLSEVATKIRDAVSNPAIGIDDIAKIVQTDASVAAHCVKIANSAAYVPVNDVREAIERIGVTATRDIITAYTSKGVFALADRETSALMRQSWRHSCRIAALSFVIARDTKRINPEQALLAGLVHDIGIPVLIREWTFQNKSKLTPDKLRSFSDELKGSIGSMILRAWHMPDQIADTTLEVEHWYRNKQDTIDLCDCVILAHAYDTSPPPWSSSLPPIEEIPAYTKLSADGLPADHRLLVVEEAEKKLQAMNEILGGET